MKQLYLALAVCLYCATTHAQTPRYWIGPLTGGSWNNTANWSASTSGGSSGDVPNGAYDVILDKNVVVNVDLTTISLNSLSVTGSVTARLFTASGVSSTITLNSTSTGNPAVLVNAGSTLEDSCGGLGQAFIVNYGNGAIGRVNGTWSFMGTTGAASYTSLPATTGLGNLLTVNGTIKMANNGAHIECSVPEYLSFASGSTFWHNRNAGVIPRATWSNNSLITITGLTANGIGNFGLPATGLGIGSLFINCPNLASATTVNLPNGLIVNGTIRCQSTNNVNLALGSTGGSTTASYTVQGNLEINPTANITLGGSTVANTYSMQVNGNFVQTGGSFYLRNAVVGAIEPTTLQVKGSFTQSAGTFGNLSTTTSTTTELFVVELNGAANQNVSVSSGTITNAANQVTLRLNNAAGATLLTPLAVGKISWNSASKGNITTTTTNILTINNTDIADALVVNGASNSGYVNGPVRRKTATNTTTYYKFPTGKSGVLREVEVLPSTATAAEFEAEYFNTAYSSSNVTAPLTGISSQEYWNIDRTIGSDAAKVRLTLAGAVTGASATDTLVVAHYTGGSWTDARGTTLDPGNSTTGSVESAELTSFSPFTFAFTSQSALPIYLLNFTGRKEGNAAKLSWTITENSTPQRFEILRSTTGGNFTQIGSVAGVERKLTYDFTDNALPTGTVYYRLRMIDIDGSAELTKVIAVMNGSKGVLITSMMPTLVTDRALLNISSSEKVSVQFIVTDIYGRSVKQQVNGLTNGNQEIWMNLGNLPTGTYQVTGYLSTGEKTSTIRFIKQ
jgi:hypothetical protein